MWDRKPRFRLPVVDARRDAGEVYVALVDLEETLKTRQFARLAGISRRERDSLILDGLVMIAQNVAALSASLERCVKSGAHKSARLTYNAGREEAGKFLVLIDLYRAPHADQATLARQVKRCGNHLGKLLYAQMADYAIASQGELVAAIDGHRQGLYLDGPMDFDFIFRNDLLSEREHALYVDLVDIEGQLKWRGPRDESKRGLMVPRSMRLVQSIVRAGIVSTAGLQALGEAWTGFQPHAETHCSEWIERNRRAIAEALPDQGIGQDDWSAHAAFVADRWPMPMVELDLDLIDLTVEELVVQRDELYERFMRRELGL